MTYDDDVSLADTHNKCHGRTKRNIGNGLNVNLGSAESLSIKPMNQSQTSRFMFKN